jgi:RimJ/RimL family protein N-acetyltransferase
MDAHTARRLGAAVGTDRLWLEPLGARHADLFFEALQDEALYEWISMERPDDLDALRRRWQALETGLSPDGTCAWPTWAVRRRADQACLGRVDAEVVLTPQGLQATNLGYYLFPAHWGQGHASEAVAGATRHLVAEGVARLVATVTAGNQASVRVLQKAGYAFTRVLKDHDCIRGTWVDDLEFVYLARA